MKFCNLFSKLINTQSESYFEEIIGYDHIKRLFRMALDSDSAIHVLLVGRPASAKTMFLTSLMQLKNCYFADGGNSTKAGMIDYILEKRPRYLLIDEIDKMASKNQVFLLNLMETGIISETKYGKTRSAQIKTSVFATSNYIKNLSDPLRSRFFLVELEPYTYEQFVEITKPGPVFLTIPRPNSTCRIQLKLSVVIVYRPGNGPTPLPTNCRNLKKLSFAIPVIWVILSASVYLENDWLLFE